MTSTPMARFDPESLWHHLEASNVTFRVFDDKDLVSDQKRADRFIAALDEPLPQFVYIRLRNDQLPEAPPDAEHPYAASWMEDNDLALGRILDALSHSRWWPETAVFVTESNDRWRSRSHRFAPEYSAGCRSVCETELCLPYELEFPWLAADGVRVTACTAYGSGGCYSRQPQRRCSPISPI